MSTQGITYNDTDAVTADDVQKRAVAALAVTLENTLANYALGLLVALMVLLVTALVGGEFVDAIPADGPFSEAITGMTDNAATAFIIFGVGLLVLPAVGLIVLVVNGFGRFGGMGGGR